jgi:CheY-like chemotaxis protein
LNDAVAPSVRPGEEPETVLVVDQDPLAREALSDLLRSAGFETREAAGGFEALLMAREARPSAVLLDVTLSGMTGYDLCRSPPKSWSRGSEGRSRGCSPSGADPAFGA